MQGWNQQINQQNQQTLKLGKAEMGAESTKGKTAAERKTLEKEKHRKTEAQRATESVDTETGESRDGGRITKRKNCHRKEKH